MDNYETPSEIFEEITNCFGIYPNLDVCATYQNRKCKKFFDESALSRQWTEDFFMNPPYSQSKKWVKYAYFQHIKHNVNGLAILPVSTGSTYWHDYIFDKSSIAYYKGRISFEINNIPQKNPRYDTAFVCWHKHDGKDPKEQMLETLYRASRGLSQTTLR